MCMIDRCCIDRSNIPPLLIAVCIQWCGVQNLHLESSPDDVAMQAFVIHQCYVIMKYYLLLQSKMN